MPTGTLVSIFVTPAAGQPMQQVSQASALPGMGLEGDRYASQQGTYSQTPGGGRELTLVEIEAIEALNAEEDLGLTASATRRNLLVRGVALNHLVDKEFRVGSVHLRGVRLCEPCDYLARLTHPEVLPGLLHRGGLRVEILTPGVLHAGDEIEW